MRMYTNIIRSTTSEKSLNMTSGFPITLPKPNTIQICQTQPTNQLHLRGKISMLAVLRQLLQLIKLKSPINVTRTTWNHMQEWLICTLTWNFYRANCSPPMMTATTQNLKWLQSLQGKSYTTWLSKVDQLYNEHHSNFILVEDWTVAVKIRDYFTDWSLCSTCSSMTRPNTVPIPLP